MDKIKKTKQQLDNELLILVHDLRPFERIVIKKDDFGKPGKIIILTEGVTLLDYEEGSEISDKRNSI